MDKKQKIWIFAYGENINPDKFISNNIKIYDSKSAILDGWQYTNYHDKNDLQLAQTNIIESPYNFVEGTAFLIDEKDLNKAKRLHKSKIQSSQFIKFRGDNNDIPKKEAYIFYSNVENNKTNTEYINSTIGSIDKFKSQSKKLSFPFMQNSSNGMKNLMTFESFIEKNY